MAAPPGPGVGGPVPVPGGHPSAHFLAWWSLAFSAALHTGPRGEGGGSFLCGVASAGVPSLACGATGPDSFGCVKAWDSTWSAKPRCLYPSNGTSFQVLFSCLPGLLLAG